MSKRTLVKDTWKNLGCGCMNKPCLKILRRAKNITQKRTTKRIFVKGELIILSSECDTRNKRNVTHNKTMVHEGNLGA